ncbi:hypothetical protein M892_07370 [Vibrio campbellii ATCC BAA-1116]|nr:hypothetical protein M892_07370 [Vibrio campbellii ATCC BAA-1116]
MQSDGFGSNNQTKQGVNLVDHKSEVIFIRESA